MANSRGALDAGIDTLPPGPIGRAGWRRLARVDAAPLAAVVALVAYLTLVPLGYLLWETFGGDRGFTLENFGDAYSTVGLGSMARDSLLFAVGSGLIALVTGTALAFLVVRTDIPFRRVVFVGSLVPLIVPGILYTISWILLASPRIGVFSDFVPVGLDVFSMPGMVVVEGLHLSPLVFLLMAAAFRSMDPALEESALMSGAPLHRVVRRVTLPLARPALYASLLIMIVRGLESFEVPALLGIPAGIWVFTSRIWRSLDQFPADLGEAGAYSLSLLLVASVGVFLYSRLARRGLPYQTITGRGHRARRIELGRWRLGATALAGVYLLVASVMPLLILLYASTQRFYSVPSLDALSEMTLDTYGSVMGQEAALRAFGNSLLLAVATATAVMLVMAIASWIVVRSRLPGRWLVDNLASLPLAIPGLVLGVALLFVYLRLPVPVYGTLWILLLAYFTRFMPYGMRYAASAMHQIGSELEESARTSGATFSQAFRRVTLPLLLPGLLAGWIYVVIVAMRELSSSILLYTPETEVLAVRIFVLYEGGQFTDLAALGIVMVLLLACLAGVAYRLGARVGVWSE
jgi:iron(III) transport system permease protein